MGPLFLYHNTFMTDAPGTDAFALLNPGVSTFIRARNNVMAGTRNALYKVNPVALDWNFDDLYTTGPTLVSWHGTNYNTLAAFRTGTGQELQGLSAPPQLVDPAGGNFQPAAGSPLIDNAQPLPGINDGFRGAAPDIGAFEAGGGGFLDVPPSHPFYTFVETLARNSVTGGCSMSPPLYCPDDPVTRAQMAIFLLRSKEGSTWTPPACVTPPFADVPCSSPYAPWIAELAARGVTGGCGSGNYCPNATVTRDQMAVFLLRTLEGPGYTPPACTVPTFIDVPCSSPFARWIYELVARSITGGCGGAAYCPLSPVTRGQMAVFLVVTFHLP